MMMTTSTSLMGQIIGFRSSILMEVKSSNHLANMERKKENLTDHMVFIMITKIMAILSSPIIIFIGFKSSPKTVNLFVHLGRKVLVKGELTQLTGIVVNSKNEIIVAEFGGNRLQVFDYHGKHLRFLGHEEEIVKAPVHLSIVHQSIMICIILISMPYSLPILVKMRS